jgi:hypothetical protein
MLGSAIRFARLIALMKGNASIRTRAALLVNRLDAVAMARARTRKRPAVARTS